MRRFNEEFSFENNPLRKAIEEAYRQDETEVVERILKEAALTDSQKANIETRAKKLVEQVRLERKKRGGIDAFMFQYDLSSEEGIALMCLAEALLRIPDKETIDKLIRDKLSQGDWQSHLGKSHSLFVNAATWGLMLTGKIIETPHHLMREEHENSLTRALKRLTSKGGEPIVRQAISQAMKILGRQFVMGRTIEEGLKRAQKPENQHYRFSYDMLGEAAYTAQDAEKYFQAYLRAIKEVGSANNGKGPILGPGISVKLSALHPRFQMTKRERLHEELLPRLETLVRLCREANIGITVDAEEAHTLMINLELIQAIIEGDILGDWPGFGLAVQAYQKRAPFVLDYLIQLARTHKRRLMIRLVKGAYWDTEIKLSQVQGLSGYPVFTRKVATDVNYIVCAKKLLQASDVVYPQFATHNALTLSTIMELAKENQVKDYEFQCLHGMGDALYDQIVLSPHDPHPCRVYAPVGSHEELLAYLVRRLLENGANTSFVNRIQDEKLPIAELIADPVNKLSSYECKPHPKIPLPVDLYGDRPNSRGLDLSHPPAFMPVLDEIESFARKEYEAKPTFYEKLPNGESVKRFSPIDNSHFLGVMHLATKNDVKNGISIAQEAFTRWQLTPASTRASYLLKMAELLQVNRSELLCLLTYEGGKTIDDAISEVREAIDFCYYYANQALQLFAEPQVLTGPTGEYNALSLHGRGIIACISPWNFPLAIFLGQVTAALAAGNCAIAKPASQTPFIAAKAISLLHEAGFPKAVVQLMPGSGNIVGNTLVTDDRIKGILFTGSTDTARGINLKLAARPGPIVPFVAETGGQNAMIVDSSALSEQVTQDVITSAFRSAGQRCSALRVLFVQEKVADKMINMIKGAMAELKIGHPAKFSTDVGPVIDVNAKQQLEAHLDEMRDKAQILTRVPLGAECHEGSFFAPTMIEIPSLDMLTQEVFGPVLHVIRFAGSKLDEVIAQINQTGYGLTMGIHSRIDETIQYICDRVRVGNMYVNRNMIGAVVGVQPFGGEGLSGTGPKAGGPHYLTRLATERTLSINTTASGGNATLMSLIDA